jgi:hypothetical protein
VLPWQAGGDRLTATSTAHDPEPQPELPNGVSDGDWVQARIVGWDGRTPEGVDPFDVPAVRTVTGMLTVMYVEVLDVWRYTVNGQSIDPTSVARVDPPTE